MNIQLGRTSRYLRKALGLTQKEMAVALGISHVHMCNIENNKSQPSLDLLQKYRDMWDIDLYVLAWSLHGDVSKLPTPVQKAAGALALLWKREIRKKLGNLRKVAE